MSVVWVVIDEGCQECGVESEPVGIYLSADDALRAANERNEQTGGWRDGGQTFANVHRMTAPVAATR